MLDELRTMDWVPRLVRSKHTKMEEARKSLEAQHGRPPTDAELAERLGLPLDEYEKMAMDANAVGLISLNKKWYETDSYKDVREIDILEDKKGEDPTRRLQRKDLMRMVTKGLNRNERLIIILYYYEELTMKEIGATLDLSESRVSQMHSSIIQRLQSQLSAAPARVRHLIDADPSRVSAIFPEQPDSNPRARPGGPHPYEAARGSPGRAPCFQRVGDLCMIGGRRPVHVPTPPPVKASRQVARPPDGGQP